MKAALWVIMAFAVSAFFYVLYVAFAGGEMVILRPERRIDCEARVVCYTYNGVSCLALDETALVYADVCGGE